MDDSSAKMQNNFLHFDLECVRKRDGHTKHTQAHLH